MHLDAVLAEEELRATRGKDLTLEQLHDLVRRATGSERAADRVVRARASAQMRAGAQPG